MRIVIIGAGVAGCVMARRLSLLDGVEVTCLERVTRDDHSEAGTGLNVGPNAVKAVKAIDPELADRITEASFLWHNWRISLTDGKVRLLIRPCNENLYRGMRQGLDHIGFKVENLAQAKQDLDDVGMNLPQSAPQKLGLGKSGMLVEQDLQGCHIGKHAFADPDGVLMDLTD